MAPLKGKKKSRAPRSKRKTPACPRFTLDPIKPLSNVKYNEFDSTDVSDDPPDDIEDVGPFHVVVNYLDLSKPGVLVPDGPDQFNTWFGPYQCIQEANDAALILAMEYFRDLTVRYYEHYDCKPKVRIVPTRECGGRLQLVDPEDPNDRFWICATPTKNTPDDEVQQHNITKQGWDVYVVTCSLYGGARKTVIAPSNATVKRKVSVSRHNANKYAVSLFLDMTKFLLDESKRKEYVEDIQDVTEHAEKKMIKAANDTYTWTFQQDFVSLIPHRDAKGVYKNPKTFIRVSVDKFDVSP